MYKIYYLTSKLDDMKPRYVGYTTLDLEERLHHHICESKYKKSNTYKVNWINKVINNAHKLEIIKICDSDNLENTLLIERYYVEEYNKVHKLTNSTNGGESSKSFIESVKSKISNSLREYYKYNRTWNKGLKYSFSEDRNLRRRIKMGDKIKGENNHFYGKSHTFETRKKLSENNRIYNYDYDTIFRLYLIENLTGVEISIKIDVPATVIRKAIRRYGLVSAKKEIYGRIKGYKPKVENIDFEKYYNKNLI